MGFVEVVIVVIVVVFLVVSAYLLVLGSKLSFYRDRVLEKYFTINSEIMNIASLTCSVGSVVNDEVPGSKIQDAAVIKTEMISNKDGGFRMSNTPGLVKALRETMAIEPEHKDIIKASKDMEEFLSKIEYATDIYNKCVDDYNEYKNSSKIVKFVFKLGEYKDYDYCDIIEKCK